MRIGEGGFREGSARVEGLAQGSKLKEAALRSPAVDSPTEGPSPFARVLRSLGREVDHGEKVVRRAIDGGGKDLGPGELLALQAGVYRYSEAVDLSAKLIDRATSGVKTVLQGQ